MDARATVNMNKKSSPSWEDGEVSSSKKKSIYYYYYKSNK